jgi:hypothetical protein
VDFDGGAAAMLGGDDTGADGGAPDGVVIPPAAEAPPADGAATPSADDSGWKPAAWMEGISGEVVGDQPSHIDYLKSKGVTDINKFLSSYREAERAISGKGVVTVPKEGSTPEEIAAYHRQIGVPEAADKSELPSAPEGQELDMGIVEPLREIAFKAGVPADGFKALAAAVVEKQVADQMAEVTRQDGLRDGVFREWGADKDRNTALFQRGMRAFGIDAKQAAAIQKGMGSDGLLKLGLKLGQLTGEDMLMGGGGAQNFGMTGEQAQARIDAIIADPAKGQAIKVKGSAEAAEWDRLNTIVAHHRDLRNREAQG